MHGMSPPPAPQPRRPSRSAHWLYALLIPPHPRQHSIPVLTTAHHHHCCAADGVVELTLTKAEGMHWWSAVLQGDPTIDVQVGWPGVMPGG